MNSLNIKYQKHILSNRLQLILHVNNKLPLVSVNLWYGVGSANEIKGKTGLAHLFEHMMFQGSQNVPKELHFRYIQEAGGSLNGSTSFDRTNYYEKLPSNFTELALWLESDRMGFFLSALDQSKLDNQKSVVLNERLERYDNQPYGLAWEKLVSMLYLEGHPYSWPTIGYKNDIENYNLKDVSDFFSTYYTPNNASLVIAGDFKPDNIIAIIEKYFSEIPAGKEIPAPPLIETQLTENKFLEVQDNIQLERIYLAWHSDTTFGRDDAALDILADILCGSKNSRLYKKLVFENELAQDVSAYQFSGKYAGHFMIIATAKPGTTLENLKSEIFKEINNVIANGVSKKELIRSKNGIISNFIFSLQNIDSLADQLNLYNFYLNEPNSFTADLNRYNNVNEQIISKAAKTYLDKPYVQINYIPGEK